MVSVVQGAVMGPHFPAPAGQLRQVEFEELYVQLTLSLQADLREIDEHGTTATDIG